MQPSFAINTIRTLFFLNWLRLTRVSQTETETFLWSTVYIGLFSSTVAMHRSERIQSRGRRCWNRVRFVVCIWLLRYCRVSGINQPVSSSQMKRYSKTVYTLLLPCAELGRCKSSTLQSVARKYYTELCCSSSYKRLACCTVQPLRIIYYTVLASDWKQNLPPWAQAEILIAMSEIGVKHSRDSTRR